MRWSLCMLCGDTEVCLFRNRNHIKISHDFEQFVDREMHPLFFFVLDLGFKGSAFLATLNPKPGSNSDTMAPQALSHSPQSHTHHQIFSDFEQFVDRQMNPSTHQVA